jgi:hypothetical protein
MDFGFDTSVAPSRNFENLPPGWYAAQIDSAESVMGKNSDAGEMLKVCFELLPESGYAGRKFWRYLCINHQKTQTRDIARDQLKAICHGIGKPGASRADELLGGQLMLKLVIKDSVFDGVKQSTNEVAAYKSMSEATTTPASKAAAPAAAPKAAPKPWAR